MTPTAPVDPAVIAAGGDSRASRGLQPVIQILFALAAVLLLTSIFTPWYSRQVTPVPQQVRGEGRDKSDSQEQDAQDERLEKKAFFTAYGIYEMDRLASKAFAARYGTARGLVIHEPDGSYSPEYARAAGHSYTVSIWCWETARGLTCALVGLAAMVLLAFILWGAPTTTRLVTTWLVCLAAAVVIVVCAVSWWFACPTRDVDGRLSQGPFIGPIGGVTCAAVVLGLSIAGLADAARSARRGHESL